MLLAWWPLILAAEVENRWTNCIDFTNLTNTAVCTCYSGTVDYPMARRGVVDNGPSDETSRHTVHTDVRETDPRTGGKLHTVPAGELLSMRLGTGVDGDVGGAIEYAYTPTLEDGDMLILRYAVVFDTPKSGHEENQLPHFMLQVLDATGNPLGNEPCFFADFRPQSFAPGELAAGWHTNQYIDPHTHKPVMIVWKEWTTVFFSLHEHVGEPLRIRLITTNCSFKEHFAYAYFTIHCNRAAFYGIDCGMPSTHFEAPEGFAYRWYRKYTPEATVSTEHVLDLQAGDTAVYCVDIQSNTGCSITLEADPQPDLTPQLTVAADSVCKACADGNWVVPFSIEKGSCDSITLLAGQKAQYAGFSKCYTWHDGDPLPWTISLSQSPQSDDLLQAGEYAFTLKPYSSEVVCGEPEEQTVVLQLSYLSITSVQRGSYIFLLNQANNGGYDFSGCTFQWYQDGKPIVGQNGSQLCVGNAADGTEFYCEITDSNGVVVSTCPIRWVRPVFTSVDGNPDKLVLSRSCQCILLQQGESLLLEAMEGRLYDAAGRLVYAISNAEGNLLITAPQPGIYLLKAENQILRVIVR